MRILLLCFIAIVLPLSRARGQAKLDSAFKYHLGMKSPEGGPNMPNVRLGYESESSGVSESFTSRWNRMLRVKIDLTTRADRNPDDSYAEGAFGHQWAFSGKSNVIDTTSKLATDYGMVGLYGDARYETNQSFSEQLGSAQLRLIYTHNNHTGIWLLIPQAQGALGVTTSVGSEVRDSLNLGSDSNLRLEGEAYWIVDFRAFSAGAIARTSIAAEWRGFRTNGLDPQLASMGFESGNYFGAEVGYAVKLWAVNGVYVRWSTGRLPSQPVSVSAWLVGVRRSE